MDTPGLLEEASQAPVTLATTAVFKSNRADILTNQRVDFNLRSSVKLLQCIYFDFVTHVPCFHIKLTFLTSLSKLENHGSAVSISCENMALPTKGMCVCVSVMS